jgi:tetratricopeptide (TPR) repeat protein
MSRCAAVLAVLLVTVGVCLGQFEPSSGGKGQAPASTPPPRSDQPGSENPNESSSRDTQVDLSPPSNDYEHEGAEISDVTEFHKYDPHRADKDLEVGGYYEKQGNYRGALLRYEDALDYMPNNPTATFRLAEIYDKLKQPQMAARYLVLYRRLAPKGEFADEAKRLQEKLRPVILAMASTPAEKQAFALVDEGTDLLGAHDFHGAIAKFQQALAADPHNSDAAFFLADAYEQNGLFDDAGGAYRAYLQMYPDGIFADAAKLSLQHLPALRGQGLPVKPELPTSLPSENPR